MHLCVRLSLVEGPRVPYDHNFLLGSAVYRHLRELSDDVSGPLHNSPYRSPYVLSEIHHVPDKAKEAWFRLGTSSEIVAELFGKAIAPGKPLRVGPSLFQVKSLRLEDVVVRPGEYVTLSPILLRDKETSQSLVHDSPGYQEILQSAINRQVGNYLEGRGSVKVLHLEQQAVRKRTIEDRTFLAQKARLILDGEMEELRFLVDHGIGASPALGFGMVIPTMPLDQLEFLKGQQFRPMGGEG